MDTNGKVVKIVGNRKGMAAVYIALILFALVAFVGLAIDIGYMYVAKGQLQNAADAAALAGAKLLDGTAFPTQTAARVEARLFAGKNKAAGETVLLDLNQTNDINGDIIIGYWSGSSFTTALPSGKLYNAVKVIARRTDEAGTGIYASNKPVSIFFGKVLGWFEMGAKAEAIAAIPLRPTAPISLCIDSCPVSVPAYFYFKENDAPQVAQAAAWTELSDTSKATNFGPDSVIAQMIRGEIIPPNACGKYVYTNNAGSNQIMKVFRDEFTKQSAATGYWEIVVPIMGNTKTGTTACPPGAQPDEPYLVVSYALIRITEVDLAPEPKFKAISINCQNCDNTSSLGSHAFLVK